MRECSFRSRINFPAEEVFKWHLRPFVMNRFLPPSIKVKKESVPGTEPSRVQLQAKYGIFRSEMLLEFRDYFYPSHFTDVQIKGPFQSWTQTHKAIVGDEAYSFWEDKIVFSSCFSRLVEKKLRSYLAWRHKRLQNDLTVFHRYPFVKQRILVSGSSGFVGREIVSFLRAAGHEVVVLVRRPDHHPRTIYWDPEKEGFHLPDFENFDAFIHLAGENLTRGVWTEGKKDQFFRSRCRDTWLLAKIISRLASPPKKLLVASAVGYYGSRPKEVVDETSRKGEGFLSDLVFSWEHVSDFLKGIQVLHTRFGVILGPQGGVLPKLLLPIRLGLGAVVVGSGNQMQSWISIEDVVGSIYHLLHQNMEGPVVIASPHSVSQKDLALHLVNRSSQKKIWNLPNLFGQMGKELLMASISARPTRLEQSGYQFLEPNLSDLTWY